LGVLSKIWTLRGRDKGENTYLKGIKCKRTFEI